MAPHHKNFDPAEVRRTYWRHGANVRETAAALDTSRETVYAYLGRAEDAPVVVVNLKAAEGVCEADLEAIAIYLRACLERAGIRKEAP